MTQDRRTEIDITPSGHMEPAVLANYAQTLIGKKHLDGSGKVIGEIRSVRELNGRLIAEVKLSPNVILG